VVAALASFAAASFAAVSFAAVSFAAGDERMSSCAE
jgi:hypothetical protein